MDVNELDTDMYKYVCIIHIYLYLYIYIQIYLLSNLVLVSAVSYLSFPEFTSPFPGDFLVAPFLHCFPFWFLGCIFSAFSICTCITYVYAFFQKASVEDKPTSQQHKYSTCIYVSSVCLTWCSFMVLFMTPPNCVAVFPPERGASFNQALLKRYFYGVGSFGGSE